MEIDQERVFARYRSLFAWAKNHKTNMLVSYPRSGRFWLAGILVRLLGKPALSPNLMEEQPDKYSIFLHHGGLLREETLEAIKDFNLIFLVRDPRDCALSDAYRRVYHHQHSKIVTMNNDLLETAIADMFKVWPLRINDYENLGLTVQYEQLCLRPVETLNVILEYIDEKPIMDVAAAVDKDFTYRIAWRTPTADDPSNIQPRYRYTQFASGWERYLNSCLKWLHDDMFTSEKNKRVCDQVGDYMERYGYLEKGHDIPRWLTWM